MNSNKINVKYCPTKSLVCDFYSKPLQGILSRQFWNFTLNIQDKQNDNMNYFPRQNHRKLVPMTTKLFVTPQEECVRKNNKSSTKNVTIVLPDQKRKTKS